MYKIQDISVIIPTYNRSEDLAVTLESLKKFFSQLNEVLIVDQSNDLKTKRLLDRLRNRKVKYVYSSVPSITIARNRGVKRLNKRTKIICFLDDDVTLGENYFSEILRVFNENREVVGVGAYVHEKSMENFSSIGNFFKKIFFLGHLEKNRARMISAYGNTYPFFIDRTIQAQWLPGANMVYKREVFDSCSFDENLLGYTVAEDTSFSYSLFKKSSGGIYITPSASFKHRFSQKERTPTAKISYINQVDHFYLNFKLFNSSLKEKTIFAWSLFGIFSLRLLNMVFVPRKETFIKLKFFLESLFYCFSNMEEIKKGNLRDFEEII